ncbi:hypothetical protein FD723_34930 (plasmid) [Nostoc sp. C052]|uniref:hypothetical protein n=1 Tax=Nostoc sp. C052 TaxID=2576902 RepID=UPI0015C2F3B8|nr:hypothetical protein [Nostoc sp. C052]QLE45496.1 hypothetical protein FD723_34930 [Nostoc sp. C052]
MINFILHSPTSDRDHQVLDELHQNLAEQGIIPEKHLVDTAYIDAQLLVDSWQWWTQANNFGKSISRFAALAV